MPIDIGHWSTTLSLVTFGPVWTGLVKGWHHVGSPTIARCRSQGQVDESSVLSYLLGRFSLKRLFLSRPLTGRIWMVWHGLKVHTPRTQLLAFVTYAPGRWYGLVWYDAAWDVMRWVDTMNAMDARCRILPPIAQVRLVPCTPPLPYWVPGLHNSVCLALHSTTTRHFFVTMDYPCHLLIRPQEPQRVRKGIVHVPPCLIPRPHHIVVLCSAHPKVSIRALLATGCGQDGMLAYIMR
jgi:hypothetical protein